MVEAHDEDAALVARAAVGDGDAFAALYRRYLPLVLGWCVRETANRELAADLAGEVFATALASSRRYRPDQGSVAAWLLGISRNKVHESRRRKRVENSTRHKLGIRPLDLSDVDLERIDELASLDGEALKLVEQLPAEQREALVQRVVQERSYNEIADELRCSESVVRQRVSRGLKALRAELEGK